MPLFGMEAAPKAAPNSNSIGVSETETHCGIRPLYASFYCHAKTSLLLGRQKSSKTILPFLIHMSLLV